MVKVANGSLGWIWPDICMRTFIGKAEAIVAVMLKPFFLSPNIPDKTEMFNKCEQ